ncbi:hypothetical protein B566_EDAN010586 [Ephemera danica]|nr:hypothetical protein B566_EDAN010586 [Ephemera danica]
MVCFLHPLLFFCTNCSANLRIIMFGNNDMSSPDCNKKIGAPGHRVYRPLGDLNGRVGGSSEDSPLPKIYEETEEDKENCHNSTPRRRLGGPKSVRTQNNDAAPTSSTPLTRKHTTPKTPRYIPRNPFDADLIPKLHLPICSPSVFTTVVSPTKSLDENFDWPIEDISRIKPVQIEESPESQFHYTEDPETESRVQEAIDTFFKEKQIVPSPWSDTGRASVLDHLNFATQTALSLPVVLPPELEAALKPYFNQEENDEQSLSFELEEEEEEEEVLLSQSGLRRKLLFHAVETHSDPPSSPLDSGHWKQGFSRSNLASRDLRSPSFSPIARKSNSSSDHSPPSVKMTGQGNSSRMSMEVSFHSNATTPLTRRHSSLLISEEHRQLPNKNSWSLRQRFMVEEDQSMESCSNTPVRCNSPQQDNLTDHGYHTDLTSSRAVQFSFWNCNE